MITNGTGEQQRGQQRGTPATATAPAGPPAGWIPAATVARSLGRPGRTVRDWVAAHVPDDQQGRWPRPAGGSPAVWLSPAAVETLRALATGGDSSGAPAGSSGDTGGPATAPAGTDDQVKLLAAEVDRLNADLAAARAEVDHLQQRLSDARQQAATMLAEVMTSRCQADRLRASWWRWYALLVGRPLWRLRSVPPPPDDDLPPLLSG